LNSEIAKSAAWLAALPYFPAIPTPMFAFVIIETSLAPSPIARVLN